MLVFFGHLSFPGPLKRVIPILTASEGKHFTGSSATK